MLGVLPLAAGAQSKLAGFLTELPLSEVFPGAERLGPIAGDPPATPAYRDDQLLGYVFVSTDVVPSIGYSGKPIHVAIGLDNDGRVVGAKLLEHSEPIVLIGIPEKRVLDFIGGYVGTNLLAIPSTTKRHRPVDAISGATVTVMVIDDIIIRAGLKVARSRGLGGPAPVTGNVSHPLPGKPMESAPTTAPTEAQTPATLPAEPAEEPLWQRLWRDRVPDIAILVVVLMVLTLIFFFQNWLARRPRLTDAVRLGFLLFILVWLGWYANAQLSVVNVLTFSNALLADFRWDYFLMDPLLFILWSGVAASLLFWGRGPFCGWLCPFGALQELLNRIAKLCKVPQVRVPWGLHERLWPIKYMIFLGLFGLSLYSLAWAERLSEVEPFKTVIILKFVRDWPFVVYAVALLVAGLFIERFFCRYLCPLGAVLAIPGRLRMFEWLRRYKECGSPCQRCGNECMVQAIHPEGQINPNECLYCLHCQTLYYDDHRCPVMIQRRLKREKASALATKAPKAPGQAAPTKPFKGD